MPYLRFSLLLLWVWTGQESIARSQNSFQPATDFRETVSLDTDSSVTKKLGTVHDYIAEKQWMQAVDILQEIARSYGGTLIKVSSGRYVNVAAYCDMVMAGFPPAGLAAYRQKTDPQARRWFETGRLARDEEMLGRIIQRAFASSYGDDALLLLGERQWEQGHFSLARNLWIRLLKFPNVVSPGDPLPILRYPDSEIAPAEVRARLILCSIFEGNRTRTQFELNAFRQLHPNAEGTLIGRVGKLVDILDAVSSQAKSWQSTAAESDHVNFASNVARNKVLDHAVKVGALEWSVRFGPNRFQATTKPTNAVGRSPLSHFPVVYRDMVLFNDADRIFAYNLHTGRPYWPFEKETDRDEENRDNEDQAEAAIIYPTISAVPSYAPSRIVGVPRYTMTVHEGRLYARLGAPITGKATQDQDRFSSHLIGLDLANGEGKLVWKVSANSLDPESREWSFEGSPVVTNGRVYVALRRSHPQTQMNVACYDAETAKLVWNRRVSAGISAVDATFNLISHNLLTYAENTIFYSTDMGAIAALDADNGSIKWVVTYESQQPENGVVLSDPLQQGLLPCVYHQGTIIAAPNDTKNIFAIDAETGMLHWKRPVNDRIRHLLGVGSGKLIAGGNGLWAIDIETGQTAWKIARTDPAEYGYGRGLLVEDDIWWPTREKILIVNRETGTIQNVVHLANPSRNETGGNLLIAGGHLLIAQPDRLAVFSEYSGIIQRSRKEMAVNSPTVSPFFPSVRTGVANNGLTRDAFSNEDSVSR